MLPELVTNAGRLVRMFLASSVALATAVWPAAAEAAPEVTGLRFTPDALVWNDEPTASEFHVYRGAIADLDGKTYAPCRDDLDADRTDIRLEDPELPAPGAGYYYLITADVAGAEGTLGFATKGERVNTCPCRPIAVSTFHSLGLYWAPLGGSATTAVEVRYRESGSGSFRNGHALWFDGETSGYSGSLVQLAPGTTYDVELTLLGGPTETLQATTWSEVFPVGQTVFLPESSSTTLAITQGGSPNDYTLYTHAPGATATIDVQGAADYCLSISASRVIVRDLILKGAKRHCIVIKPGATDVIIEENDISNWGTDNYDAAVRAWGSSIERVVIQRNLIHDPRNDTTSWCETPSFACDPGCVAHPVGPNGIRLKATRGNHVVRYNTITTAANWLQDGISLGETMSGAKDSDIHGNSIEYVWDNPIEAEADDRNVRIWGNFIDHSYSPLGITPVDKGPLYIWRNVFGYNNRKGPENCTGSTDSDPRGRAFKAGYENGEGGGRVYIYHNTILHALPPLGLIDPLGLDDGIMTGASSGNASNMVSRNNIVYARDDAVQAGGGNDYDHDLYWGDVPGGVEPHGIHAIAVYDPSNAPDQYYLALDSPGLDAGVFLPNFGDGFTGAAPDIGAYERGAQPLEFGVDAYR